MLRDDGGPRNHLERGPQPVVLPPPPGAPAEQRKRMLIALGVLLVALFAVVLKDWDFWFPPRAEAPEAAYIPSATKTAPAPASAAATHEQKPAKAPERASAAAATPPMTAKTERTALPPLEVEVVAGNRHTRLPARSNAININVAEGTATPAPPPPAASEVASAADRVQLSPQATQSVTKSVPPNYPLLARQMRVQGAVILQALISREGTIQELQILSGPGILATAAREAVKQWRFKPYVLNGEPVETQAKITVNFTISTN